MESLTIRDATKEDIQTIADYCIALLEQHYELDTNFKPNDKARESYFSFLIEAIESDKNKVLVAEINNCVIGYALGEIHKKPPVFALEKYGFISDVYIIDKFRKQGISKQLFKELYLWFEKKGLSLVELSVHLKNKGAAKTFEKAGFQQYMIKYRREI